MYNKIQNIILSWIFPEPKETKGDKMIKVITEYFLLVNEIPYDDYRISFHNDRWVQISLIYNSWEDASYNIKNEDNLEKDMGNMFPYKFVVNCLVSG
jgi:competence transcription factor ComK